MHFYYAFGGGLGHLTRAWLVLRQFNISTFKVITASPLARLVFPVDQLLVPPEEVYTDRIRLFEWFCSQLRHFSPSSVILDTFPAGILGEFDRLPAGPEYQLVARRLKWKAYVPFISEKELFFHETLRMEPLEEPQEKFLQEHSSSVTDLRLDYHQLFNHPSGNSFPHSHPDRRIWLIVHSEPADEVEALLGYAREIAAIESETSEIWLCTQAVFAIDHPQVHVLHDFPVLSLFSGVERLFTAGGFNSVRLHDLFQGRHHFLPFPRRYDDQFWRVNHWKTVNQVK